MHVIYKLTAIVGWSMYYFVSRVHYQTCQQYITTVSVNMTIFQKYSLVGHVCLQLSWNLYLLLDLGHLMKIIMFILLY